jgi:hypothetical protein
MPRQSNTLLSSRRTNFPSIGTYIIVYLLEITPPVLVHVVSQRARVLRLRRTERSTRDYRGCCIAFLPSERSRRPVPSAFRSSIARPTDASVYASSGISRRRRQDLKPGWIRCSFPVGLFLPLQHAGLSRRSTISGLNQAPERWATPVSSDSVPDSVACLCYEWLQKVGGGCHAANYLGSNK